MAVPPSPERTAPGHRALTRASRERHQRAPDFGELVEDPSGEQSELRTASGSSPTVGSSQITLRCAMSLLVTLPPALAANAPRLHDADRRAAVAVVARQGAAGDELLFIR